MAWVWHDTVEQVRYAVSETPTRDGRCALGAERFKTRHMHILDAQCVPIEPVELTALPLPPRPHVDRSVLPWRRA